MSTEKKKHTVWLNEDAWQGVLNRYHEDNCTTKSEFVEKAIYFYCGYLNAGHADVFLSEALSDLLHGTLNGFAHRIGRLLFKQAVECNMTNHMIAADTDIDLETLDRLRGRSVREVQETNGEISLRDDLIFQKSV